MLRVEGFRCGVKFQQFESGDISGKAMEMKWRWVMERLMAFRLGKDNPKLERSNVL